MPWLMSGHLLLKPNLKTRMRKSIVEKFKTKIVFILCLTAAEIAKAAFKGQRDGVQYYWNSVDCRSQGQYEKKKAEGWYDSLDAAIEDAAAGKVKEPKGGSGGSGDDTKITIDQIVEAIGTLSKDTEGHFTKGGKPEVKAIEAALGEGADITSKQRDEAWKIAQG